MRGRGVLGLVLGLLWGCSSSEEQASDAGDGFEPLFDGKSLDGIEVVGLALEDLAVNDGVLECQCKPNGYFYKNEVFSNFDLRLEFRFARPPELAPGADSTFFGNSGYFVYLEPPHEIWPRCLEVQGSYPETGDIFGLPGLTPVNDAPDLAGLALAKRPVGEWNELRIESRDGALEIELNANVVNTSTAGALSEGLIAFESEGAEIHWRNVRIKRLP